MAPRPMIRLVQSMRRVSKPRRDGDDSDCFSSTPSSEIRVLDDTFAEPYDDADHSPKQPRRRDFLHRLDSSRRAFATRRRQFAAWTGQAQTIATKTLRECCTLARQELEAWRSHTKETSSSASFGSSHCKSNVSSSQQRQCSRTSAIKSAYSSFSVASPLSSATDLEEERRKEIRRSEFSLCVISNRTVDTRRSHYGFVELARGGRERLMLVRALPLNDSDEEEDDGNESSASRHLPFRMVVVDGRPYILPNEWV